MSDFECAKGGQGSSKEGEDEPVSNGSVPEALDGLLGSAHGELLDPGLDLVLSGDGEHLVGLAFGSESKIVDGLSVLGTSRERQRDRK